MCPYDTWQRGTFIFCEAHRCGWIQEPVNTLSNVGFLGVGLWLLYRYRQVPQVRVIGWGALLVGILSSFYHATGTYVGEVLDLGSMYLVVGGLAAFNLQRLDLIRVRTSEYLAVLISVVGMIVLFEIRGLGRPIFDGFIQLTLVLELVNYLKARRIGKLTYSYRFFWTALACHFTAFFFWWLDNQKIVCYPTSLLIQAHAVWHLIEAGTLLCLGKFYLQFWKHSEAYSKR